MRLINPDEIRFVLAPIAPILVGGSVHYEIVAFQQEVDVIPGIEAEPVKHAHWIAECPNKRTGKAYRHRCSECGRTVYDERQVSIDEMEYHFCPHCGAKMEVGENAD